MRRPRSLAWALDGYEVCTGATLDRLCGMRRLTVLLTICVLAACSRYEWVPDYLSPECATTGRAALARVGPPVGIEASPQMPPGAMGGTVMIAQSGKSLDNARITLSTVPLTGAITDSLGRFELQGVAAGRYAIAIRRIGFTTTRDSITVPREGGLRLAVQLAVAPLDGPCRGFGLVRVRKPWWKVW